MRDIKFRVWNSISKEYTYFRTPILSLDKKECCPLCFLRPSDKPETKVMLSGYGELEQFTGLLDKNGKEIYEGDIAVQRNVGGGATQGIVSMEISRGLMVGNSCLGFDIEIIGNIHENPELLESKNE